MPRGTTPGQAAPAPSAEGALRWPFSRDLGTRKSGRKGRGVSGAGPSATADALSSPRSARLSDRRCRRQQTRSIQAPPIPTRLSPPGPITAALSMRARPRPAQSTQSRPQSRLRRGRCSSRRRRRFGRRRSRVAAAAASAGAVGAWEGRAGVVPGKREDGGQRAYSRQRGLRGLRGVAEPSAAGRGGLGLAGPALPRVVIGWAGRRWGINSGRWTGRPAVRRRRRAGSEGDEERRRRAAASAPSQQRRSARTGPARMLV